MLFLGAQNMMQQSIGGVFAEGNRVRGGDTKGKTEQFSIQTSFLEKHASHRGHARHHFQCLTIQPLTQLRHRSAMHHSTTLHLTKPPGQQWESSIKNLSDHKAHFANQSHPPDHLTTKHEVLSSHQILQHNNQPAGACNLSSKERSQVSCVMNIFDSFD